MPRFNNIDFYQTRPNIRLFLQQKVQNFQALGAPPPNPYNTPQHSRILAMRLVMVPVV